MWYKLYQDDKINPFQFSLGMCLPVNNYKLYESTKNGQKVLK